MTNKHNDLNNFPLCKGARVISVLDRSKNKRMRHSCKNYISSGSVEFFSLLEEAKNYIVRHRTSDTDLRIYSSVNGLSMRKAMLKFNQQALEAMYSGDAKFYTNCQGRFVSCLMKSPSENLFLLDIDEKLDDYTIKKVESRVSSLGAEDILVHNTPKGHHVVTTGFDPWLFQNSDIRLVLDDGCVERRDIKCEVKKNALLFLCSQDEII